MLNCKSQYLLRIAKIPQVSAKESILSHRMYHWPAAIGVNTVQTLDDQGGSDVQNWSKPKLVREAHVMWCSASRHYLCGLRVPTFSMRVDSVERPAGPTCIKCLALLCEETPRSTDKPTKCVSRSGSAHRASGKALKVKPARATLSHEATLAYLERNWLHFSVHSTADHWLKTDAGRRYVSIGRRLHGERFQRVASRCLARSSTTRGELRFSIRATIVSGRDTEISAQTRATTERLLREYSALYGRDAAVEAYHCHGTEYLEMMVRTTKQRERGEWKPVQVGRGLSDHYEDGDAVMNGGWP